MVILIKRGGFNEKGCILVNQKGAGHFINQNKLITAKKVINLFKN